MAQRDMASLLELGHIRLDSETIALPQRSSHGWIHTRSRILSQAGALRFAEIKHFDAVEAQRSEQAWESPSASRVCSEADVCVLGSRPSFRRASDARHPPRRLSDCVHARSRDAGRDWSSRVPDEMWLPPRSRAHRARLRNDRVTAALIARLDTHQKPHPQPSWRVAIR